MKLFEINQILMLFIVVGVFKLFGAITYFKINQIMMLFFIAGMFGAIKLFCNQSNTNVVLHCRNILITVDVQIPDVRFWDTSEIANV